jgi:hypothetical protein
MTIHQETILITMTKEDQFFRKGKVMYLAGKENAHEGDLGTILLPAHAKDVQIDPETPDPVVFSYSYTEDDVIRLRVALIEIISKGGVTPSSCTISVLVPSAVGNWVTRTKSVTLVLADGTTLALCNPHGLAQQGNYLYFIDYESRLIIIVKKSDLEAAADNGTVKVQAVDMSDLDYGDLPNTARGQAIAVISGKLIVLCIDTTDIFSTAHSPGHLLRFDIDTGAGLLTLETQTKVGRNPQGIVPVITKDASGNDVIKLLVHSIGGPQDYNGATNGILSDIRVVDALGTWPDPSQDEEAQIVLTGDAYTKPTPPDPAPDATAFDIHSVGAAMRDGQSLVYILTQVYVDGGKSAYWMLYLSTVNDLLNLIVPSPGTPLTLSQAVATSAGKFKMLDEGIVIAPEYVPDPDEPTMKVPYAIYFWGIVYEQAIRKDDKEDRLYIFLGSPFLITKAAAYSSPTTEQLNPYVVISGFGGVNTNSVDVTIETLHQAIREVSLHRGVRAARIALSRPAVEEESE